MSLSISKYSDMQTYNQEFFELVDKILIKSSLSKEMKEKGMSEIFQMFLFKINEFLINSSGEALSDIIINKSQYLKEISPSSIWASPDTLKVSNLNRSTLFLYNYIRYKYSNFVRNKDTYYRAFENLVKFFDVFIGFLNTFNLTEDCFLILFNDFFLSYVNVLKYCDNDIKDKAKEEMEAIINLVKEETNIESLITMTSIEPIAQKGFFIGMLAIILEYKVRVQEDNNVEISGGMIEKAYKHKVLIKEISPLLYIDFVFMRSLYKFLKKDLTSEMLKETIQVFKFFKLIKKFKKGHGIIFFLTEVENCLKYLVLLYSISFGVIVDSNLLEFLLIKDNNLKSITIRDNIILDAILQSKNFSYINEMDILRKIKKILESLVNTQYNSNEILPFIYEKESIGFKDITFKDDILELTAKFNQIFQIPENLLNKV